MRTRFISVQIKREDDTFDPFEGLTVQLVRHDGSVQAELVVAAGYRLVADGDGVRSEHLAESWLREQR